MKPWILASVLALASMAVGGCASQKSAMPIAASVSHSGVYYVAALDRKGHLSPVENTTAYLKKGTPVTFDRDATGGHLFAVAGEYRFDVTSAANKSRLAWYRRGAPITAAEESGAQHRSAATTPPDLLDYPYDYDAHRKHRSDTLDSIPD
jgi:hypothetical protein